MEKTLNSYSKTKLASTFKYYEDKSRMRTQVYRNDLQTMMLEPTDVQLKTMKSHAHQRNKLDDQETMEGLESSECKSTSYKPMNTFGDYIKDLNQNVNKKIDDIQ